MAIWDDVITERDRAVFEAAGFTERLGFGQRPALLVIDMTYDFVGDDEHETIFESLQRWHSTTGPAGWRAVRAIEQLLLVARAKRIPIVFTRAADRHLTASGPGWRATKNRRYRSRSPESIAYGREIVREIAPLDDELVIDKYHTSAFFQTPLLSHLQAWEVDTIIVTGTTTSGCVRATVVDGHSNNFRPIVVEEATADRGEVCHKVALFDIHHKLGDVVSLGEALDALRSLPDGLFAPVAAPLT